MLLKRLGNTSLNNMQLIYKTEADCESLLEVGRRSDGLGHWLRLNDTDKAKKWGLWETFTRNASMKLGTL